MAQIRRSLSPFLEKLASQFWRKLTNEGTLCGCYLQRGLMYAQGHTALQKTPRQDGVMNDRWEGLFEEGLSGAREGFWWLRTSVATECTLH